MQNNECIYVSEQFTDYLENSLSVESKARVDAHLAVCTPCHDLYQSLDQVLDRLHSLPTFSVDKNFTQNLISQIEQLNQESIWRKIYQSSYTRVAGYAIAAGLVVALGINVWLDPVLPLTPNRVRSYTSEQADQNINPELSAGELDSLTGILDDSLRLNNNTINSGNTALHLVSGTK